MFWKNKSLIVVGLLLLWGCNEIPARETSGNPLIEVAELTLIDHSRTRIIDFRKAEAYTQEHIPGALNLWREAIENPNFTYGGMLAEKGQIEQILSELGITNEHQLVLYDDRGLPEAARFWWALNHYGFSNVKLLNGGLHSWKSQDMPVESGLISPEPSNFSFPDSAGGVNVISKEELFDLISSNQESYVLVDTRSKEEFLGNKLKNGAAKAGRIPSSVHLDWSEAIHFDGNKKLKSLADLERIFGRLGASKEEKIIVYCHSGVRSSHTYFVLTEMLGYTNVLNYDGSWTEWSHTNYPYIDKLKMIVKN
ncbi:sulfurtransferase [Flavobacteriaceae bacterium D16]|nr:sulfurtransferase [Flavobacteriaceae bacterium D16]